ncbi:hypothetical protein [Shewanella zhangzhouensis]|uniref:hypothetical protein n=1 Tax=Shewanella zhangzhouensis TaxID=2864213 RepID=UPI001C657996|nr:hypothetical protein [Shewanella zhangzhouensis]QYK05821.1 hypothetical protein K0H63_02970 [Shewanella zhangzhouensis]
MDRKKKTARFLRKEFGVRKRTLPESLKFLNDVCFHAVIEENVGNRTVRTIEMKPRSLKNLVSERDYYYEELFESKKSISHLKRLVKSLKVTQDTLVENISIAKDDVSNTSNSVCKDENLREEQQANIDMYIEIICELEKKNLALLEENSLLLHNNEILMRNIDSICEPEIKRNENAFFNDDVRSKTNAGSPPIQGGAPQ